MKPPIVVELTFSSWWLEDAANQLEKKAVKVQFSCVQKGRKKVEEMLRLMLQSGLCYKKLF